MSEYANSGVMTRAQAIDIACAAAKAKPQSYYAEPFEPHEWVIDAILEASTRSADEIERSDLLICDCAGDPVLGHVPGHWVACPVCVAIRTGRPLEQDALRVAVDAVQRLVSKAKQFERYPGAEGARRALRDALDELGVLDEDRRGQ